MTTKVRISVAHLRMLINEALTSGAPEKKSYFELPQPGTRRAAEEKLNNLVYKAEELIGANEALAMIDRLKSGGQLNVAKEPTSSKNKRVQARDTLVQAYQVASEYFSDPYEQLKNHLNRRAKFSQQDVKRAGQGREKSSGPMQWREWCIKESLAIADDVPTNLPAVSNRDPHAALAAWDIIRDKEFYVGLPPDELEEALEYLYALRDSARSPDYVDQGEVVDMIEHVEGLLGYGLGEETIDIPLG